MSCLDSAEANQVTCWTGNPDSDAAHREILRWLRDELDPPFLSNDALFTLPIMGNLGEAIAFFLGSHDQLSSCKPFPANALAPLSAISRPDVDIVWLLFGQVPSDDRAILQEVKTTGQSNLSLADELCGDYQKLFGTDTRLTLHTRLQGVKVTLRFSHGRPELSRRVSNLGGNSPQTSQGIRLLPTLVHDLGSSADTKMTAVRTTLVGLGWGAASVDAWAIGLIDLVARLRRLSMGQP